MTESQQGQMFQGVGANEQKTYGGAGLGLAIAKGLVINMKGEIGVESKLHEGSTFWFTVQLGIDREKPEVSPQANTMIDKSVLIFYSNPVCRVELEHLLSFWGIHSIEVGQHDKIEKMLDSPPLSPPIDLVIFDASCDTKRMDTAKLTALTQAINHRLSIPAIILAPPKVQRLIQDATKDINTTILNRPVLHTQLYRSICNLLNISINKRDDLAADLKPSLSLNKPASGSTKILIIDHNQEQSRAITKFLQKHGSRVESVCNGNQALDLISNDHFDLIFLNIRLPKDNGVDISRKIRKTDIRSRTPIIALNDQQESIKKADILIAGMDDLVSTPIDEIELTNIFERWVNTQKFGRENTTGLQAPRLQKVRAEIENPATDSSEAIVNADAFVLRESIELAKGDRELAKDMLIYLINSLDETEASISQAVDDSDLSRLQDIVHKFYGGCCYCGVPKLKKASKAIDKALQNQQIDNLVNLVAELKQQIRDFQSWVEYHDIDALFE